MVPLQIQWLILLTVEAFGRTPLMEVKTCAFNPYVEQMYTEYAPWTFDNSAIEQKGRWRERVFKVPSGTPVDLEIGTGNGTHFAQITEAHPERCYLGLELKYKTLVQSIRRSLRRDCTNARMARIRAEKITEIFSPGELNNVYIHFPDPWPKKRHNKNRLIKTQFLGDLYSVMAKGSFVEFKTDDYGYFLWAKDYFKQSDFTIKFYSEDLHNSFRKNKNFITHFESLFLKKGQPIYYCLLQK